ncbi:MAG: 1-acyl-sn-glycerol-3-phosphate acyltransferase [Bacteroidales bacterium]
METQPINKPHDLINVDEIFRRRGQKIYPFIPGFLIRYLENVVHQDEVNEALNRLGHLQGLEFVNTILAEEFRPDIRIVNPENVPYTGRYILASNHPLGGLDGLALMHVLGKKRKDLKFLSNDLLMEIDSLRELFVPVNKHGRNSRQAVTLLEQLYESDSLVLVFPAGLVSRRQKGEIRDLQWQKSFVTKAVKYHRDIIPVHIDGHNSDFFYSLANWRKRLGIKMNIEMLYLPNEMFKQRNKKITITFGKPISCTTFTGELSHLQWAQKIKDHVYTLPQGNLIFKPK